MSSPTPANRTWLDQLKLGGTPHPKSVALTTPSAPDAATSAVCTCPLTDAGESHLDSDSDALPFWFNCPINGSCLRDLLSLGSQLLWKLAPESNCFSVSGCVFITPVFQLRDASSFPAFKIHLHGDLTIWLLCGQVSSPITTEPTLSSACPWFTASVESSTQSGWTCPNSLNPIKTLTRLLSIFFTFSPIPCQTSSSGIIEKMNRSRRGRQIICNDPAGQCWNQNFGWFRYNLRHPTVSG